MGLVTAAPATDVAWPDEIAAVVVADQPDSVGWVAAADVDFDAGTSSAGEPVGRFLPAPGDPGRSVGQAGLRSERLRTHGHGPHRDDRRRDGADTRPDDRTRAGPGPVRAAAGPLSGGSADGRGDGESGGRGRRRFRHRRRGRRSSHGRRRQRGRLQGRLRQGPCPARPATKSRGSRTSSTARSATTREHDLHRFTPPAMAWRDADGDEGYWQGRVGAAAIRAGGDSLWPLLAEGRNAQRG